MEREMILEAIDPEIWSFHISCEPCRKSKVKCSKDRPVCVRCAKTKRSCVYKRRIERKALKQTHRINTKALLHSKTKEDDVQSCGGGKYSTLMPKLIIPRNFRL